MSKLFNFENLTAHDLYHLRYGKGALIVAIHKEDPEQSRKNWETAQEELCKISREVREPIRKKIKEMEELKMRSGKVHEIREHNGPIEEEIAALKRKLSFLAHQKKPYFTNLQIAQFYTHNLPAQSEVHTRFDKISSIEESGTHVEITLEFSDRSIPGHHYHLDIGARDHKSTNPIEGQVKRIVPIENVTLEVINRNSFSARSR